MQRLSVILLAIQLLQNLASGTQLSSGHVHTKRGAVTPQVASVRVIGNVTDPHVNRDSCGSARFGDRALWTCRDTTPWDQSSMQAGLPLITNTASWTNFAANGEPWIKPGPVGVGSDGSNPILLMYGGNPTSLPPFFPLQSSAECSSSGLCKDNTRWVAWPDYPPIVTGTDSSGIVTAYTWIARSHKRRLTKLNPNPAYTMYKVTYTPSSDLKALPSVSVVNQEFWTVGEIGYGDWGGVVTNGTLYVYGLMSNQIDVALARVATDSIEDKSKYEYYMNGAWTSKIPSNTDAAAVVTNAGLGGQGTYYWSSFFESYIWIGQKYQSGLANFLLSTAPKPEGPWIKPYLIYSGANGNGLQGSYSLQAHPALLDSSAQGGIYLSWTQWWNQNTYDAHTQPLVYVEFKGGKPYQSAAEPRAEVALVAKIIWPVLIILFQRFVI